MAWSNTDQLELIDRLSKDIIGKSLSIAERMIENNFIRYRVRSNNGVSYVDTCDYVSTRLNLTIEEDVVTKVTLG